MAKDMKRTMVGLPPEWEEELQQLKKEKFYDTSRSEMIRYLMALGIKAYKEQTDRPA